MSMFQKATKTQLKARVAMDGPAGAGKTWTALTWAQTLGKRIAVIDTERGSAALYSDRFEFDTAQINPPYAPDRLMAAIKAAETEGYDVIIIDSLSHFWDGEGGVLDIADAAGQRAKGNTWAGWKTATPVLRHLVDSMLALDAHLIVTMRSKTEWTQEEYAGSDGKTRTRPVRIGMAPVMRAGMEYEFTVVGDLDIEHRLTISKSRCEPLADLVVQSGRAAEAGEMFAKWLSSGEPVASRNDIDALLTRMNQLEPKDLRAANKQAFADRFGNPMMLLASKLAEARAYVEGWFMPPDGGGSKAPRPDGGEGEEVPSGVPGDRSSRLTGEAPTETAGKPVEVGAEPAPKAKRPPKTPAQLLHIDAGRFGVTEADLDVLIMNDTNGRTASANDLSAGEMARVQIAIRDIDQGRLSIKDVRAAVDR